MVVVVPRALYPVFKRLLWRRVFAASFDGWRASVVLCGRR